MGVLCVFASLYVSTDAYSYGLTRFGHYGYPRSSSYVYNSLNWPGVKGPGFESTCWGCKGKRSADADSDASAEAEPGYLRLGYTGNGYADYGYGLSNLGWGYSLPSIGYRQNRVPFASVGFSVWLELVSVLM